MAVERLAPMRISDLARAAGLPKSTVAYYVRMGLLSEPTKTGRTMAYYNESHLNELRYITRLRKEGTPIAFIGVRLGQGRAEDASVPSSRRLAGRQPARRRPQREDPARRREQIISAASRVFLEKGYDRTSIEDIVGPLGIGRSTFYLYFRDKGHLFLECIDSMFNSIFTSEMWEAIRQEHDAMRRLDKRARITLKVSPNLFEILQLVRSHSRREGLRLKAKGRQIYARVVAPVKADLERGMRQGVFRKVDSDLLGYVLLGTIESLSLALSQLDGYTEKQALDVLEDFIGYGLAATERTAS